MAIYETPARRRRLSWGIAAVALVVGLLIGLAAGRVTAPTVGDKITEGRAGARDLVAALRVLPLEYRQAASGTSETGLIDDTIARATGQLPGALDGAPWLSAEQRRTAADAVDAVEAAARAKVPPARFEATTTRSVSTLQSVFGLPVSGAG